MMLRRIAFAALLALLGSLVVAVPATASTAEVAIDGVTYTVDPTAPQLGATVTSGAEIAGALALHGRISHDGVDYAVTAIAAAAFRDSAVATAIIPSSVTTIGAGAFDTTTITSVTFLGDAPALDGAYGLGGPGTIVAALPGSAGFGAPWTGGGGTIYTVIELTRAVQLDSGTPTAPVTVAAGQSLQVEGSGFAAGESVTLVLSSSVALLGTLETDLTGRLSAVVTVPADATPGAQQLVVTASATGESRHGVTIELPAGPTRDQSAGVTDDDAITPPTSPSPATTTTALTPVTSFTPGFIIADENFYIKDAMTEAQIQDFLNERIGMCQSDDCLNVLRVDMPNYPSVTSTTTGNLICSSVTGGTGLRAATVIYRVQQSCGLSAKVILVTLQKEQGLVTSRNPSNYALSYAMGWACPDSTGCVDPNSQFNYQVYRGARQLVTYKLAEFARQPGVHNIQFSPTTSCGFTAVNVRNYATAALYNYTPYQPTAAALAAWPAAATPFSPCNAYGNRNFWFYYNQWFGNPTVVGSAPPVQDYTFRDVPPDRAFADEIEWLATQGITSGFSDGTFRPLGTVNRDAMAAFIYRLAGEPSFTPPTTSPFTDVTPSTPFYREITWLATQGITEGFSDGLFRPWRAVPRNAMAAFLYRFAGSPDFTAPAESPFIDMTPSSPFYREVMWLASTGITGGFTDQTFRPDEAVNRDAMAAFLFRFDELGLVPD